MHRQSLEKEVPSYRARINIIGHSGAGKTTLTRRLLGDNFVKNIGSTNGVETHRVEVDLTKDAIWSKANLTSEELEQETIHKLAMSIQTQKQENMPEKENEDAKGAPAMNMRSEGQRQDEAETHQGVDIQSTAPMVSAQAPENSAVFNTELIQALQNLETVSEEARKTGILRLWDFGGQTEFYTTHHLFLDSNAVNIIVMDISKGLKDTVGELHAEEENQRDDEMQKGTNGKLEGEENRKLGKVEASAEAKSDTEQKMIDSEKAEVGERREEKVGVPTTQEEFLCYWLRTIQLKTEQKQQQAENVLLVLTHKDKIKKEHQKREEEFKKQVFDVIMRNKLPQIGEDMIHVVDNTTKEDDDFTTLRGKLFSLVGEQKVSLGSHRGGAHAGNEQMWGAERKVRWLSLEADILKAKKISKHFGAHLSLDDIKRMAQPYNIGESELQEFLEFYNMTGDFVYLPELGLGHTVITAPQWLINIFKVLITPQAFVSDESLSHQLQQGWVDEVSLQRLFKNENSGFIVDLMQTFDLIFPDGSHDSTNRRYIIPSLLPQRKVNTETFEMFKQRKKIFEARHVDDFDEMIYIGAFSRLMSKCAAQTNWLLRKDVILSYDQAVFEVEKEILLVLSLPHGSIVDVSVWCKPSEADDNSEKKCAQLAPIISSKLKACQILQDPKYRVLCCLRQHKGTDKRQTQWADLKLRPKGPKFVFKEKFCPCHRAGEKKNLFPFWMNNKFPFVCGF